MGNRKKKLKETSQFNSGKERREEKWSSFY
jgi:hypothetical protein